MIAIFNAIQNSCLFDFFAAGDITATFHQVRVPPEDQDALRFYRWVVGREDVLECIRMLVNIFGSSCSTTLSSFALNRNADDHVDEFPEDVIKAIRRAYVDDVPTSAPSESSLAALIQGLIDLCKLGGFPLTKFVSNSRLALEAIPEDLRKEGFKDTSGPLPETSVLGVLYSPEEDVFRVKAPQKPGGGPDGVIYNRRMMLSLVMGIFDPIGFVAPFVLLGKKINQQLCNEKVSWNDPAPEKKYQVPIQKWVDGFNELHLLSIRRSFALTDRKQPLILLIFTDASIIGYGCVAFFLDEHGRISWVAAKSRVSPTKETNVEVGQNIPRLELQAAVTGVELALQIREDIDVQISRQIFFTDSTTVYHWIHNQEAKHPVYVANRLNRIHVSQPDAVSYTHLTLPTILLV